MNRPNNIKALISPATRMVLAALGVAEGEALVVADPELEVPLLAVPKTPPATLAGTVESEAFAAADLNASRVFGPLELQVNSKLVDAIQVQQYGCHLFEAHLRRVDDSNHASLAVRGYTTVEPDGVGIVDGHCEDHGLLGSIFYSFCVKAWDILLIPGLS
jgi:hypothetical protein